MGHDALSKNETYLSPMIYSFHLRHRLSSLQKKDSFSEPFYFSLVLLYATHHHLNDLVYISKTVVENALLLDLGKEYFQVPHTEPYEPPKIGHRLRTVEWYLKNVLHFESPALYLHICIEMLSYSLRGLTTVHLLPCRLSLLYMQSLQVHLLLFPDILHSSPVLPSEILKIKHNFPALLLISTYKSYRLHMA